MPRFPSCCPIPWGWATLRAQSDDLVAASRLTLAFVTPPAGLSVQRLVGMLGYYVGVGLIAYGAWQLWSRRTA